MDSISEQTMLEQVEAYHKMGFSLIPLKARSKDEIPLKWKRYQTQRAGLATIRRWFGRDGYQPAVLLGDVSGGIVSRDFDTIRAYENWAAAHRLLASALPTVITRRGRHVYAKCAEGAGLLATGNKQYVLLGDGEFRCGPGAYNMLPPSVHPEGAVYSWAIPLDKLWLAPEMTVEQTGFFQVWDASPHDTQQTQQTQETHDTQQTQHAQADASISKQTQAMKEDANKLANFCIPIAQRIDIAIQATLPSAPGQRNRAILNLCRWLKGIPECRDAAADKFRRVVQDWHARALPVITTKEFEETWLDFHHAWKNVRTAIGDGVMSDVLQAATTDNLPTAARYYERQETKLLVGICRELQRRAGEQPFFLGCRTAAELLKVEHNTAARWLRLLVLDGIIQTAEPGTIKGHRATSYRYMGE